MNSPIQQLVYINAEHTIYLEIIINFHPNFLIYIYKLNQTYELAYSMSAKMYQYYLNSTNHCINYDQQNVIIHRLNSKMNEIINRKSITKLNDSESNIQEYIIS